MAQTRIFNKDITKPLTEEDLTLASGIDILNSVSGVNNLGTAANPFGNIYVDNITATGLGGNYLPKSGGVMTGSLIVTGVGTNIYTATSGVGTIGSPGEPFNTIFVNNVVSTGAEGTYVNITGDTMTGPLAIFSTLNVGSGNIVSGLYSTVRGLNNTIYAGADYAHAEGAGNTIYAGANDAHVEGSLNKVYTSQSHAEGYITVASGQASHSEGINTEAHGDYSHAEGSATYTYAHNSHAEGDNTETSALALGAHAEGGYTVAAGRRSHAEGEYTTAAGNYSHSEGRYTIASGVNSHVGGFTSQSVGDYSFAHGYKAQANHDGTVVFTDSQNTITATTIADSMKLRFQNGIHLTSDTDLYVTGTIYAGNIVGSSASGSFVHTSGDTMTGPLVMNPVRVGFNNTATGTNSSAVGFTNTANGTYSSAVGFSNTANGVNSAALGFYNTANGLESSAVGIRNIANGTDSTAVGWTNTASNTASTAIGYQNFASGTSSSAIGSNNTASGISSAAIGYLNTVNGSQSSAIGFYNTVEGTNSSAIGHLNTTIETETSAIGYKNIASGSYSSAIGWTNTANGSESSAIGFYNHANGTGTTVIGKDVVGTLDDTLYLGAPSGVMIQSGKNLYPETTSSQNIGSSGLQFAQVYAGTGNFHAISGLSPITLLSDMMLASGVDFFPVVSGVNELGTAANPFKRVFADSLVGPSGDFLFRAGDTMYGNITLGTGTLGTNLLTAGSGTSNIGSSDNPFSGVYADLVRSNNTLNLESADGFQVLNGIGSPLLTINNSFYANDFIASDRALDLYISSGIITHSNITPSASGIDLGSSGISFGTLYVDSIVSTGITTSGLVHITGDTMTGDLNISGASLIITSNGGYNINSGTTGGFIFGQSNEIRNGNHNAIFGTSNIATSNQSIIVGDQNEVIGGFGNQNAIFGQRNIVSGNAGQNIVGGYHNILEGDNNENLIGGNENILENNAGQSIIGGGSNRVNGDYHLIAGISNVVSGNKNFAVGESNNINGNYNINGGYQNITRNNYSIALGSNNLASGSSSVAIGTQAKAIGAGTFVLTDSQAVDCSGSSSDAMYLRFQNGVTLTSGTNLLAETSGTQSIGSLAIPFSGVYALEVNDRVVIVSKVNEVPSGTIDGANAVYTLTQTPYSTSLTLFRNGLLMTPSGLYTGVSDYSLSTNTITFNSAPVSGSILLASYGYQA